MCIVQNPYIYIYVQFRMIWSTEKQKSFKIDQLIHWSTNCCSSGQFLTITCVAALYERMRADQRKFGKSAWAIAVERMERLQYAVSKETLQLMRAKEICLEQKKHGLKEEVKYSTTPTGLSLIQTSVFLRSLWYSVSCQSHGDSGERCQSLDLEKLGEKGGQWLCWKKWPHGPDMLKWSE